MKLNSTIRTAFYKMDHVLYEIFEERGIPLENEYDHWKREAISELLKSGYIKLKMGWLVLTDKGRDVINHDSLLSYLKKDEKIETVSNISVSQNIIDKFFSRVIFAN